MKYTYRVSLALVLPAYVIDVFVYYWLLYAC